MIKKKNHIVDVKGWCQIQRSCHLIWKYNLNNQHTFHQTLKLKILYNLNGKCSQLNDYTNIYEWNTKKIYNNYILNFKVNQLKIILNGNINLKILN
jgi:hypothetical protein